MGMPVKRLELTDLDDGRQRLLVEVEDTVLTWFGHLEIEPQLPGESVMVSWELVLKATRSDSELGQEWARFEVQPPPDPAVIRNLFGR